jgi:hypothetical protein
MVLYLSSQTSEQVTRLFILEQFCAHLLRDQWFTCFLLREHFTAYLLKPVNGRLSSPFLCI